MSSVRLRRLAADYRLLEDYIRRHPRLRLVQSEGDPPEKYQVEYRVKGLRQVDDETTVVGQHLVEVALPRNYPRTPPVCRMLTPVFHPNIAPHAICVGDHWSAGEPLWSIIARIGEMLAYQSYNTKSPLNGEAARWVESSQARLPLDTVSMLVDEQAWPASPSPSRSESEATATGGPGSQDVHEKDQGGAKDARIRIGCSSCGSEYRVAADMVGKRVRCKKCQNIIQI